MRAVVTRTPASPAVTSLAALTLLWRRATQITFTHRFNRLPRMTMPDAGIKPAASWALGLALTVGRPGRTWKAHKAVHYETAPTVLAITLRTRGTRGLRWIRII